MLGLVTLGQLLVLLVAGIDLSVGAVMDATLIVIAELNRNQDRLVLSLLLCLALGAAVGLVNGLLVSYRNVPPFAATLGMLAVIEGANPRLHEGRAGRSDPVLAAPRRAVGRWHRPLLPAHLPRRRSATDVRAPARDLWAADIRRRPLPRGRSPRGDLDDDDPRFRVRGLQRPGGDSGDHPQRVRRLRRSEDRRQLQPRVDRRRGPRRSGIHRGSRAARSERWPAPSSCSPC